MRVVEHRFGEVLAILWGRPIVVEFGGRRPVGHLVAHIAETLRARR